MRRHTILMIKRVTAIVARALKLSWSSRILPKAAVLSDSPLSWISPLKC